MNRRAMSALLLRYRRRREPNELRRGLVKRWLSLCGGAAAVTASQPANTTNLLGVKMFGVTTSAADSEIATLSFFARRKALSRTKREFRSELSM